MAVGLFKELDFNPLLEFSEEPLRSATSSEMGKAVTYNDYLDFNYLIGLALIENDSNGPDQTRCRQGV